MSKKKISIIFAILAALLYAINIPISKILIRNVEPVFMASFLYLGAGIGLLIYTLLKKEDSKNKLTKKELPYTVSMVVLDILAPIFLMLGISRTSGANVSLLNNLEIVATSIIAYVIFKEKISKRLLHALVLVVLASIILSYGGRGALSFNLGSIYVLLACICWGMENNCTKMISNKSSVQIVIIKGLFSGGASFLIALIVGESIPQLPYILCALLLGFVSYGLSINFYILGQKNLGAAKTSAYYSTAPFLGVLFSLILLGERPDYKFYLALIIMTIATVLMVKDNISLLHTHEHEHIHDHEHSHGDYTHSHEHAHSHTHEHIHEDDEEGHLHSFKHENKEHSHSH